MKNVTNGERRVWYKKKIVIDQVEPYTVYVGLVLFPFLSLNYK